MLDQQRRTDQRRLIVNWQDMVSREIVPVGELIQGKNGFEFGYLKGALRAQHGGFEAFLAFPELHRRYRSATLFPFFRNRILPTTRPDYLDSLAMLGLDSTAGNELDVLGRSRGLRQTDHVETVLEPEFDSATNSYVTYFLARGVRYVDGAEAAIALLPQGASLDATLEPNNSFNPRARLLSADAKPVGYVPEYLLEDLERLEAGGELPTFVVERVNPPPQSVHHRLLVRMTAGWPLNFRPFAKPDLEPLVRPG